MRLAGMTAQQSGAGRKTFENVTGISDAEAQLLTRWVARWVCRNGSENLSGNKTKAKQPFIKSEETDT
jgi:hypothetical protein